MKIYAFFEMSCDGFIAGSNDNFEGFKACHKMLPQGELFGFNKFIDNIDVVVMGRKTFEVDKNMDKWWYGEKPVYVLSNNASSIIIPDSLTKTVSVVAGEPSQLLQLFVKHDFKNVYIVGGGIVLKSFMKDYLIDEVIVISVPFNCGSGTTPFTPEQWTKLKKVNSENFSSDFRKVTYAVTK